MTQLNLTFQQIKMILVLVACGLVAFFIYYNYAAWKKSIFLDGVATGKAQALEVCRKDMERLRKAPWRREPPAKPSDKPAPKCSGLDLLCWMGL